MLSVEVLTLFPRLISAPLEESILGKALEKGLLRVRVTDIRDFADGRHRVTDDVPYGGGAGMVMKPEPLVAAIEAARQRLPGARVILMSPQGAPFRQARARELFFVAENIDSAIEHIRTYNPPMLEDKWFEKRVPSATQ